MSKTKHEAYLKLMSELESQGIVEDAPEGSTPYVSPALIVMQNGKPRFVIDFRRINEMTEPDSYPLPRQTDIFRHVQDALVLSLFDFCKMFYQLPIDLQDRYKTTFTTRYGDLKRLTRSIMGYLNSPSHCQRILDRIIRPYKWKSIIIYIDDVIIFSPTWEQHLKDIEWFLNKIQKVGLTLDSSKSYVGFESVTLLGHVVNRFGLATLPQKIRAMVDLPPPTNIQELRSILGFFNYYRNFIENFAQIVEPLSKQLKGLPTNNGAQSKAQISKMRVVWSKEQEIAFKRIKDALASATALSHARDGEHEYRLYVDACKLGFGAALHIMLPASELPEKFRGTDSHHERPVAFISRQLKGAEINFWPTELKTAGLVWALKQFEEILDGQKVLIFTDHSALVWLFEAVHSKARQNQRLLLWSLYLQQWKAKATLKHRPGRTHLNADVLSRFPVAFSTPLELRKSISDTEELLVQNLTQVSVTDRLREEFFSAYQDDKHWRTLYSKFSMDPNHSTYLSYRIDDKLLYIYDTAAAKWKLCVPRKLVGKILKHLHDDLGHPGFFKTYARVAGDYSIPKLSKVIRSYIDGCHSCKVSKSKTHPKRLHPIDVPSAPGQIIAMDFVTGLPKCGIFDAILTITDKFSKMVTLVPCRTIDTAADTAKRWYDTYFARFGCPAGIVSDRDVRFVSKLWREIFKTMGTELLMSTAYSPQTDGQSERTNRTMEVMLRSMLGYESGENGRDWLSLLPTVEFAINSSKNETTGTTPFEILYGTLPRSLPMEHDANVNIVHNRQLILSEAKEALLYAQAMMAIQHNDSDSPLFKVGDKVYIKNHGNYRVAGLQSGKLAKRRFGPFEILELVGKGAARLDLPDHYKMHKTVSHRHLTLATEDNDEFERQPPRPPPIIEDDNEPEYEVERVIDKRKSGRRTEYLVKWLGYPVHDSSWTLPDDSFAEAIADFENSI